MKRSYRIIILICVLPIVSCLELIGQNVGIGIVSPDYRLHVKNATSELLKIENSTTLNNTVTTDLFFKTGNWYTGGIKTIGISFDSARLGFFTYASDTPGELLERMSIHDNGDVGIGTTTPKYKLDIAGRVRLRHTAGLSAGIWYNKINNTLSTFAGMHSDTAWGLYNNSWKFLFDTDNGRLGIGPFPAQYPLAFQSVVGDKISLFGGDGAPNANHYGLGIQGSLMQLFTPVSAADIAFGYGRSAAFTETMRIKGNGNVGIGTNAPGYKLDIKSSTQALLRLENSTTLAANIRSDLYFKTGAYFTGAIKTIGTSLIESRLGFFTFAGENSTDLVERVSILDNGKVGIGTTAPADLLSFANSLGNKINFYHVNSTSKYGIGLQPALLQFYTDGSLSDFAFGFGSSGSFTENFRVKGNGDIILNDGILLGKGSYGSGNTLTDVSVGAKMFWYPKKAAFRAGHTSGSFWSDANIGNFSVAMGFNTQATGTESLALGSNTLASGSYSVAIGVGTLASAIASTSMGFGTYATGDFSTAMGNTTVSSGYSSTSMGASTTASGEYSFSGGYASEAMGVASLAFGFDAISSGNYSVALGTDVSTNLTSGSFIFGDLSTTTLMNTVDDQMMMRFSGGYKLFSNSTATVGVQLAAGGNAWAVISDKNKKENFLPVDGEAFLNKISAFKLTSWNYKGQDPLTFRHYGPMAQEFYAAFGNDEYGSTGNDTTINQADFDGINLIAIQALENRTARLKEENDRMKEQLMLYEIEIAEMKKSIKEEQNQIDNQQVQMDELKRKLDLLLDERP